MRSDPATCRREIHVFLETDGCLQVEQTQSQHERAPMRCLIELIREQAKQSNRGMYNDLASTQKCPTDHHSGPDFVHGCFQGSHSVMAVRLIVATNTGSTCSKPKVRWYKIGNVSVTKQGRPIQGISEYRIENRYNGPRASDPSKDGCCYVIVGTSPSEAALPPSTERKSIRDWNPQVSPSLSQKQRASKPDFRFPMKESCVPLILPSAVEASRCGQGCSTLVPGPASKEGSR